MLSNRSVSYRRVLGVLPALAVVLASSRGLSAQQPAPAPPQGPALALSMEQAVTMALETSLGLKSERLNIDISGQAIAGARAAFLPFASSSLSRNTTESAPQVFGDGTQSISSASSFTGSGAVGQNLPWYGGRYQVTWSGSRNASAGTSQTFNPRLGSTVRVDFTQPLWQDFRLDANRAALQRTERQRAIADVTLQQRVVSTEASVRIAYLGLIAAIEGRKVAQLSMDLAETSLRNARARVAVGQSPQIDIVTFEAAVESNRDSLIQADALIATREDDLRALVLDPSRQDYWQVRLDPTDTIQLTPRQVDEAAAIQNALANRLDLVTLRRNLEITDLNLELGRNATHPSVDLNVNYAASGTGGNQLGAGNVTTVRGFGTVLGDAFGGTYPSWTFGVSVGYPLGRSAAQATLAQGQLQKQQQQLTIRDLEIQIVSDVRQAVRDVRTTTQRVQATRAARDASERQLEAEERKFEVGLSDTFTLQSRQSQLASARNSELNAMVAYNNALITLDRVQKIR